MIPSKTRILVQTAELGSERIRMDPLLDSIVQEDLDPLIALAFEEGLACFLYKGLKRSGALESSAGQAIQGLQELYEQTVLFNLRLIHDLKEVLSRLNRDGVRVVLLQGIALLQQIYQGSIGLRPMTDIDLWVRGPEYHQVARVLRESGYETNRIYPNTFTRGATTVDLHGHLIWADRIRARRHLLRGDQDEIGRETVAIDFEGERALVLSPRDQVIYLSLHAFKHNLAKLIWLVDIKLLLQRFDLADWEGLVHRAESLGLKRHLGYTLYLLHHLFRLDPPPESHRLLKGISMGMVERRLLRRKVEGNRLPSWGPLLLLMPEKGITKKLSYVVEASLPRKEVLRQVFADYPKLNRWQLYRMRVLQLFGRARLALRDY